MIEKDNLLTALENREVAGIIFIRDYIQILFDDPTLSLFTWPTVYTNETYFDRKTSGYRDALCKQIGRRVVSAREILGEQIVIELIDGSFISVSIKEEDKMGAEAVMIQTNIGKCWQIW